MSDVQSDGIWLSGVFLQQLQPDIDLSARAGLDLGDDWGLLFGVGVAYTMERNMQVRLDYVRRDESSSILFNLVYYPWTQIHP